MRSGPLSICETINSRPAVSPEGRPIRVAVVCAVDSSMKALLYPQIEAMQQAGYEVIGVCSDGPRVKGLREAGLPIFTVPISRSIEPLRDLRAIRSLAQIFKRERVGIVHTHTPKAALLGQLAARIARVPIRVNTLHGLYFYNQTGRVSRTIYKVMEQLTCRLATFTLSQSQEDVDYLLEHQVIPSSSLRWLGNGVDMVRFDPGSFDDKARRSVRREFDIPDDAFVVGILARMVHEKGFAELFEAFAEFRRHAPNSVLMHIGYVDRSRKDEVTPKLADQFGIADDCRFVGQRDDVPSLMTAMDIYCLPSHREGYPRSVMEANAMGLPAIVTNIRGCREAVIDGQNGLIVPVKDAAALTDAMIRLHDDTPLRSQVSTNARDRAKSTFDEERVKRIVLETYEQLLRAKLG